MFTDSYGLLIAASAEYVSAVCGTPVQTVRPDRACPAGQGHVRPDSPVPSCHPVASSRTGGARWILLANVAMDAAVFEMPSKAGQTMCVEELHGTPGARQSICRQ